MTPPLLKRNASFAAQNLRRLRRCASSREFFFDLVDATLRGYAQIFFCNDPLVGLLFLVATFFNPVTAMLGLLGALCANIAGYIFSSRDALFKSGLFGCNGAFIGLSWGMFLKINHHVVILLVLVSFLSSILVMVLSHLLSRNSDMPVLSIPFVLSAWLGLMVIGKFSGILPDMGSKLPVTLVPQIEELLSSHLPTAIGHLFRSLGGTLFLRDIFSGTLFFAGIMIYSRISAFFAVLGISVHAIISFFLGNPVEKILASTINFNCALVAIALGGVLLVPNRLSFLYAILGASVTTVVNRGMETALAIYHLPVIAAPFNLVTLLFLYPLKVGIISNEKTKLYPVPLDRIKSPEGNLEWYESFVEGSRSQKVKLSLPFYGTWFVSQGNDTTRTHNGPWRYAWDFIVLDEEERSHRALGLRYDDFFAFGKPVLAPAPGIVVKIQNHIADNQPPDTNKIEPWGNYLIIDHGNGEFSEISHFQQGSIRVREGDRVSRGEILGLCGNSGMSYEPHLHYQLQREPFVGAESVPVEFSDLCIVEKGREILIPRGRPRADRLVRNYESQADVTLHSYFPLDARNNWTYILRNQNGKTVKETWEVVEDENKSLYLCATQKQKRAIYRLQRVVLEDLFLRLPNGRTIGRFLAYLVSLLSTGLDYFSCGFSLLPLLYRPNICWEAGIEPAGGTFGRFILRGPLSSHSGFEPQEWICVGARWFKCVKVSTDFYARDKPIGRMSLWLADGLGIVKLVVTKGGKSALNMELERYHLLGRKGSLAQ